MYWQELTISSTSGAWAPVRAGEKLSGVMGTRIMRVLLASVLSGSKSGRYAKSMVDESLTVFRVREVLK